VRKCRFGEQEGVKDAEEEKPQLAVQTPLRLEVVDRKLELERAAQEQREKEESLQSIPSVPARSLEECIDIFENGPRPLSQSMELLTDEEVILLAQKGKIAAYALEKVLGTNSPVTLERAVRIRRALICK
jgi:hydroxymethylglutaryl-CoA reductase (NADPH)